MAGFTPSSLGVDLGCHMSFFLRTIHATNPTHRSMNNHRIQAVVVQATTARPVKNHRLLYGLDKTGNLSNAIPPGRSPRLEATGCPPPLPQIAQANTPLHLSIDGVNPAGFTKWAAAGPIMPPLYCSSFFLAFNGEVGYRRLNIVRGP